MLCNYHIEQAYQNNKEKIFFYKRDKDFCNFNKVEVLRDQAFILHLDLLKDGISVVGTHKIKHNSCSCSVPP